MEQIPLVDLKAPHTRILHDLLPHLTAVIERSDFILGEEVLEFERRFAHYVGARWSVGVANGTEALHLALRALDVQPGDEVIVPANTFVGTAFAASYVGARPILVDCLESTFLMDLEQAAHAITERTRAVLPVHLFGRMVDLGSLLARCKVEGVPLIEDAAQAHGARLGGHRAGSIGAMGCFSFYPGKNLGAFGDAGAIVTSDDSLHDRLKRLRNHGSIEKYQHVEIGFNCRLDTIQAAVLKLKLVELDSSNGRRLALAQRYCALLDGVGDLTLPNVPTDGSHVFHLFVIRTERRDRLLARLHEKGVMAGVHYPTPVHLHEAYRELGYRTGSFPVAERLAKQIMSLPLYPELSPQQQDRVVSAIRSFFDAKSHRT